MSGQLDKYVNLYYQFSITVHYTYLVSFNCKWTSKSITDSILMHYLNLNLVIHFLLFFQKGTILNALSGYFFQMTSYCEYTSGVLSHAMQYITKDGRNMSQYL